MKNTIDAQDCAKTSMCITVDNKKIGEMFVDGNGKSMSPDEIDAIKNKGYFVDLYDPENCTHAEINLVSGRRNRTTSPNHAHCGWRAKGPGKVQSSLP